MIPSNVPNPIPISKIIKLKCSTGIPSSDSSGEIYFQVRIKEKAILRNFVIAFGETRAFAIVKNVLPMSLNEKSLYLYRDYFSNLKAYTLFFSIQDTL